VVKASYRSAELSFVEPASQVSPGQAVVLYEGDEVIGGGVVEEAGR
jgi:tRNA-specific 2-thiouridylase